MFAWFSGIGFCPFVDGSIAPKLAHPAPKTTSIHRVDHMVKVFAYPA
jgi:hypothetical protein